MDELQTLRDAKIVLKRAHSRIIQLYKQEIYDWCGNDLACELVAQKSGVPGAHRSTHRGERRRHIFMKYSIMQRKLAMVVREGSHD